MDTKGISIVIPTLNEEENVRPLIREISAVLSIWDVSYEIIFIDDHSTDKTRQAILEMIDYHPIRLYLKEGKKGKAASLKEGFRHAKYGAICMIDADLQYPPSAIPEMLFQLGPDADIVVAKRKVNNSSFARRLVTKIFQGVFAKKLHGITVDVQSGLKVFKKEVIERVAPRGGSWAFDLEFLIQASHAGYTIVDFPIVFEKRLNGKSKVGLLRAALEIGFSAVKLRFEQPRQIPILSKDLQAQDGFHYRGNKFMHYSALHVKESAFFRLSTSQKLACIVLLEAIILACIFIGWHATLVGVLAFITAFYVIDLIVSIFLVYRSFVNDPDIKISEKSVSQMREWPTYTIYCPLYKEAEVVPQFIRAIESLDYPKEKLQVLLLLEEDDKETIRRVLSFNLPYYFTVLIVPDSNPKTKPKALNYGLKFTHGEYAVIYDAEDIPDPDQLKKAVLAFEKTTKKTICIQAKLKFYNPNQNILTRLFAADYSLWFDIVLPGLQSIGAPIPLGGTSNHFKTEDLKTLQGWDPFNVTEDADLGMRLVKRGYKTAIVDSYTLEEANSDPKNWFMQRSRWIKGYMQTYLVHTRGVKETFANITPQNLLISQLIIGGKTASLILNPLMWLTTIVYFAFRLQVGLFIESLFPPAILYLGVFSLFFGNFLYAYYYMLGAAKQKHWENVFVALFMPLYWIGISMAAMLAFWELLTKPFYWHKTQHGLHLERDSENMASKKGEVAIVPAI